MTPDSGGRERKCYCSHARKEHVKYRDGTNRKGSRYVCTVDNCAWTECDLEESIPVQDQEEERSTT